MWRVAIQTNHVPSGVAFSHKETNNPLLEHSPLSPLTQTHLHTE
jgi:hypothetical protein